MLQLRLDVLVLQLLDALNEISLFQAPVALLIPIRENLLQITHLQLLQIDGIHVDLFVWI